MKINISTFFYGNNYGALLQCYYLKKFIELNYNKTKVDFLKYQPKKLIFKEEISPIIKKNPFKFVDGLIRFKKLRTWKKKNILSKPDYNKCENSFSKNVSIYGSDEIWNFSNPFFGYDDFFFGKYDNSYKISYAASFGSAKVSNLKKNIFIEIKNLLKKFSYLSVRDEFSRNLLKSEFNLDSEIVLDPIFLNNESNKNEINYNGDKCIVYGNFFTNDQIKKIKNYCKYNKLNILSVGYYNDWAENNVTMNPFEFIKILKKSKIIFTSMFHGVQFSIKFKKNFWYSVDPYRLNKLEYVLNKLNLKDREIKQNSNFSKEIDYISIDKTLNDWKTTSKEFLIQSINSLENRI